MWMVRTARGTIASWDAACRTDTCPRRTCWRRTDRTCRRGWERYGLRIHGRWCRTCKWQGMRQWRRYRRSIDRRRIYGRWICKGCWRWRQHAVRRRAIAGAYCRRATFTCDRRLSPRVNMIDFFAESIHTNRANGEWLWRQRMLPSATSIWIRTHWRRRWHVAGNCTTRHSLDSRTEIGRGRIPTRCARRTHVDDLHSRRRSRSTA